MALKSITRDDIVAFVQYEMGHKDFFRLDDNRATEIKRLIDNDEEYTILYKEIKAMYPTEQNRVKESWMPYLSAAAIVLISISSYFIFMTTSENTFHINDFNLRIERSQSTEESERINHYIFQLREGKYETVVNELEDDFSMSTSFVYAVALLMHGQDTENIALIKQAKAILFSHDVDSDIMRRIDELILELEND